jgi:hypothetical protein
MHTPHQSVCTTRVVVRALTLLSGKLKGIALALAFATALFVPNAAQAQCPEAWVPGVGTPGTNSVIRALAVLPGGDVIVGGFFTTAGGAPANRIARYNPSTGVWSALGSGTNGPVYALAVLPGGDVIVGGSFTTAGGVAGTSRIARYNPSTGVWSALGSGISQANSFVFALAVLPGGDVIVGGIFGMAGGVRASCIARCNPSNGVWSALGSGTNSSVFALAVLPSGEVIAGGSFKTAGGSPANRIARYNPSTGVWSALGSDTNGDVYALAVLPGGDVIVGGFFTTAGGSPANRIARYNPSTGVWSALGSGISEPLTSVQALAVLPGGDVIVVGFKFTTAGDVPAMLIARYSLSTGDWSALGSGINVGKYVYALAVLAGGDVIAGGSFSFAGDLPADNIARYTFGTPAPTITTQPVSATVCSNVPATFSVVPSGTGPFTYQWRFWGEAINTTTNPSAATATLTLTNLSGADEGPYDCVVSTPCGSVTSNAADLTVISCGCENNPADVAGPGQSIGGDNALTADDIIVYLNWFFASDARADVAGAGQSSTPDGQFTSDDIIVFLNRFFAGC